MRYDLTQPLRDHRGKPITETTHQPPDGAEVVTTITLGLALERACIMGGPATAQQKYDQYKLAQKVTSGESIELAAEEVARLKELSGAVFTPIAVGAVWHALEHPPSAAH